jgi:dethiobiotin synthetase
MSEYAKAGAETRPQARAGLHPFAGPGLFVPATGTDVGKTVVTAGLAGAFHRMHLRVGVCKPIASGCPKFPRRGNDPTVPMVDDDFLSPDAAMAARAAGMDPEDEVLLRNLSPLRYAVPAAPATAARVEERPVDWRRVEAALEWWQENCEVLLVEGSGGWYVPLDEHDYMMADLAAALKLPVLVVTEAGLGTINQTLLTIHAILERNLTVAGLVINQVPGEGKRDLVTASNLEELPRLCGVPVRAILPELGKEAITTHVPEAFIDALLPFAREWRSVSQRE